MHSRDGEGCEAAASASPAFEAALLERSRLLRRVARTSAEKAAVALSLCPCRLLKCSSARASSICAAGDPAHPLWYQNPFSNFNSPTVAGSQNRSTSGSHCIQISVIIKTGQGVCYQAAFWNRHWCAGTCIFWTEADSVENRSRCHLKGAHACRRYVYKDCRPLWSVPVGSERTFNVQAVLGER